MADASNLVRHGPTALVMDFGGKKEPDLSNQHEIGELTNFVGIFKKVLSRQIATRR